MEFPTSPEMITTVWLDQTLRATGVLNGARVRSFDVRILDGEQGALSELVRLDLTYENDSQSTAPQRLFAKFAVADLDFRALLHSSGLYEREIRFYERLSSTTALPTPRCYFSAIDVETGEFLLLLEDMAPAQNGSRAAGCAPEQAELAI